MGYYLLKRLLIHSMLILSNFAVDGADAHDAFGSFHSEYHGGHLWHVNRKTAVISDPL